MILYLFSVKIYHFTYNMSFNKFMCTVRKEGSNDFIFCSSCVKKLNDYMKDVIHAVRLQRFENLRTGITSWLVFVHNVSSNKLFGLQELKLHYGNSYFVAM